MTPPDPLAALRELMESLDRAQGDVEARLPADQVDDVRAKFARLRQGLGAAANQLRAATADEEEQAATLAPLASGEERLKQLRAETAAFLASRSHAPPPPPQVELLDGHTLAKWLLLELGLVAPPSKQAEPHSLMDEGGFLWESSHEWNSLGM